MKSLIIVVTLLFAGCAVNELEHSSAEPAEAEVKPSSATNPFEPGPPDPFATEVFPSAPGSTLTPVGTRPGSGDGRFHHGFTLHDTREGVTVQYGGNMFRYTNLTTGQPQRYLYFGQTPEGSSAPPAGIVPRLCFENSDGGESCEEPATAWTTLRAGERMVKDSLVIKCSQINPMDCLLSMTDANSATAVKVGVGLDVRYKGHAIKLLSLEKSFARLQIDFSQEEPTDPAPSKYESIVKTMRVEGELEFHQAFFRVTRVNENDQDDDNDDDVELVVRTGTTSQDVTIEEFRSEFVEDFEIVADDVTPSSIPGEGRVKLEIRFIPGGELKRAE